MLSWSRFRVGWLRRRDITLLMSWCWCRSTLQKLRAATVNPKRISRTLLWAKMQILSIIVSKSFDLFGYMSIRLVTKILQNLLKNFLWVYPSFSVESNCNFSKLIISSGLFSLKNLSQSYSFSIFWDFSTRSLRFSGLSTPMSSKK